MLKRLGAFFFRFRDLLPVPLALMLLGRARSTRFSWCLGLPLVALGEGVRLWALMHVGPATRTRDVSAERLITTGPYAWVRNPLYLANLLKVVGLVIIAGNVPLGCLILAFYALEFACIIPFEEAFLREKFGSVFDEYVRRVPVFLPTGAHGDIGERGHFTLAEAVFSEQKTFASTGALLGLFALKHGLSGLRDRSEHLTGSAALRA